jgi:ABC-type lipoprotein export system ATPase subunit
MVTHDNELAKKARKIVRLRDGRIERWHVKEIKKEN